MNRPELVPSKILAMPELLQRVAQWRLADKKIAFTNGVFDILHEGHIFSLSQAAKEANYLIVGLNSDDSVKRLKGNSRPVNSQSSRSLLLASLVIVDVVVVFEEDTPLNLVKTILPDVLVKGGDYTVEQVAGAKEVLAANGRVVINPLIEGFSTTSMIGRIRSQL